MACRIQHDASGVPPELLRPLIAPPKAFRNLNGPPEASLTTIFAFKCADGLVMCSDTQVSTGDVKQNTTKISRVGKHAILGCAGNELYIPQLERAFQKFSPEVSQYEKSIAGCVNLYSGVVARDMASAGLGRDGYGKVPQLYEAEALLAFSDSKSGLHLFKIYAPYKARELLKPPFRFSVGSGGQYSDFILNTIEQRVFNKAGLGWENMTIQEVEQFSAFLIFTIGNYEQNTNREADIWYFSEKDRIPKQPAGKVELWGEENPNFLKVFMRTVLANHPEQVKRWMDIYLDNDLLIALAKMLNT